MRRILFIVLLFATIVSCKKDDDTEPDNASEYKFKYDASFEAFVYVWYYSGGQYTAKGYNERNSSTTLNAEPGEVISLDKTLVKDSVLIHFSNPDNPKQGVITATIYKKSDTLLSKSIQDTALYLKYKF